MLESAFSLPVQKTDTPKDAIREKFINPYRSMLSGTPYVDLFETHEAPLKDANDAMEHLARKVVPALYKPAAASAQMPHNHEWRYLSAIQKYIRRGRGDLAADYMTRMINGGQSARIWKRMNVIIAEDIGVGDPVISSLCLFICSFKYIRMELGELNCVSAVCDLLAKSVKSRDMTDTMLWATTQGPPLDPKMADTLDPDKILEILADPTQTLKTQLQAWSLIRGHGKTISDKSKRLEAFKISKTPTLIQYLAERTKTSSGYDLGLACSLLWDWMSTSDTLGEKPDPYPPKPAPIVGGVHAYAYDMHVWEGKSSITYFVKANKPVKEWFEDTTGRTLEDGGTKELEFRKRAISYALFWAEGGALDRRLTWDGHSELFREFRLSEGSHAGIDRQHWDDLCFLVYEQLDAMHGYRKRIIEK